MNTNELSTSSSYSFTDLYLTNMDNIKITTYENKVVLSNVVSEITMIDNAKWCHVEPDNIEFSDILISENDTFGKYRIQTITFCVCGKYSSLYAGLFDALSLDRFVVVGKTYDENYIMFGRINGFETDSNGATLNKNGLTFKLTSITLGSAIPLSKDAVQTVLGNSYDLE